MYRYIAIALALTGCTLSLTNVSTDGEADDVVDTAQTASPHAEVHIPPFNGVP